MSDLAKTPIHQWHTENQGRMVDFSAWSMPVQYSSIIEEHHATRKVAGLFDVSHMARFRLTGEGVGLFLNQIVTRKVDQLKPGQIRYCLVTKQSGGILDDILVYRLEDTDQQPYYWLVVNAGNREKIAAWIQDHLPTSGVTFEDLTLETVMFALQGPKAIESAQKLIEHNLASMKYYSGTECQILGTQGWISRTGYTGEDGCEITVNNEVAVKLWEKILAEITPLGGLPCGLGCRDTLRLEAAMPLYGHELTEEINPIQAGLKFAVTFDHDFIGRAALEAAVQNDQLPVRVGLQMDGRRAAREHYPILHQGNSVGEVTSGTFSPTLEHPIAMGYVPVEFSSLGTSLQIDIRGKIHTAKVVKLPFYSRNKN